MTTVGQNPTPVAALAAGAGRPPHGPYQGSAWVATPVGLPPCPGLGQPIPTS